jgi:hypothetical protein
VLYLRLIIFLVGDDIFINSETLLVTEFVNFKIKLTQSFEGIRRGRICICIFIGVSAHTYISICVYIMFLKNPKCKYKKTSVTGTHRIEKPSRNRDENIIHTECTIHPHPCAPHKAGVRIYSPTPRSITWLTGRAREGAWRHVA